MLGLYCMHYDENTRLYHTLPGQTDKERSNVLHYVLRVKKCKPCSKNDSRANYHVTEVTNWEVTAN